jgi:GNAT-family acetyltransferase (TIGR03103 family)
MGETVSGGSLWSLAVAPQARAPGIGEALSRRLAEHFRDRGRAWMDLSVLFDNEHAIRLYEKLGFRRVPFFTVKRKNEINEQLFVDTSDDEGLNPYALLIVREARRRGIHVEVTDAEGGFFRLSYGGRSVHCRESLSEFTTGVAMSICDDKAVTRRMVSKAGVRAPAQMAVTRKTEDADVDAFLAEHEAVVIKPARGEQGQGVAVGLSRREVVAAAIDAARRICVRVLLVVFVEGADLRLVVIDYRVVAAAVRRPGSVVGDGRATVRELIEAQSRRRAAATGGESRIPIDGETERAVAAAGLGLDDVPAAGRTLEVRRTANLHTGGTIHDVTADLHPALREACELAARTLDIPVTGLDLMVPDVEGETYRIIEANERPGLANHEPQPTAEAFIDLLFPESRVFRATTPAEDRR